MQPYFSGSSLLCGFAGISWYPCRTTCGKRSLFVQAIWPKYESLLFWITSTISMWMFNISLMSVLRLHLYLKDAEFSAYQIHSLYFFQRPAVHVVGENGLHHCSTKHNLVFSLMSLDFQSHPRRHCQTFEVDIFRRCFAWLLRSGIVIFGHINDISYLLTFTMLIEVCCQTQFSHHIYDAQLINWGSSI